MAMHFQTPNIPTLTKNNHQQWMIPIQYEVHALGLAYIIVDPDSTRD